MRNTKNLNPLPNKNLKQSGSFGHAQSRPGGVSLTVTVLLAGSAIAALILASVSAPSMLPAAPIASTPMPATSPSPEVTLRSGLREVGLTPINMAAAGFSAQQVTSVIEAASAHLSTHGEAFRLGAAGVRTARQQFADLEALAQSGRASVAQLDALALAQSTLAQSTTSHAEAKAALLAAALDGIPPELSQTLATVRFHAAWEVPAQYKVVARSEADWLHLREALAESRIMAASGQAPSEGCTQFLGDADADAAVSNAKARLEAHSQAITDAWNTAAHGN